MKKLLKFLVIIYRNGFSKGRPPSCRFIPSCSDYALQALEKHKIFKAVFLIIKRLLRCSPLTKNTDWYDPVP